MELNPEDVRIDHFYLGPGKGSSFKALHLPTGVAVAETVPTGSSESGSAVTRRLMSALRKKLRDNVSNEKS